MSWFLQLWPPFLYGNYPMKQFPILWLTGNTGAGKSTLAFGIRDYINEELDTTHPMARRVIVLDGDEMRATVSVDEGLSPEDRRKHNLRVARLARLLSEHGFLVIVAVIAPFAAVREELDAICSPTWVFVKRDGLEGDDRPYEEPRDPACIIDNNVLGIEEARKEFLAFLISKMATQDVAISV